MDRRVALAVLLVVFSLLAPLGTAINGYSVTTNRFIDTPDRTVTLDGTDYKLKGTSRVSMGDSLTAKPSVPDGVGYYLQLRNPENAIVTQKGDPLVGEPDVSLATDWQAGSYAIVLKDNGAFQAVHPLLIKAYSVSINTTPTADGGLKLTQGDTLTVTTQVSEVVAADNRHSSLAYVQVILADGSTRTTKTAASDTGSATVTFSTGDLSAGTYTLFATVRGDKQVRGKDELLGMSDAYSVTVQAPTTTVTTTTTSTDSEATSSSNGGTNSGGSSGGTGGGFIGGGGATTVSTTKNSTQTAEPTVGSNQSTITSSTPTVAAQTTQTPSAGAVSTTMNTQSGPGGPDNGGENSGAENEDPNQDRSSEGSGTSDGATNTAGQSDETTASDVLTPVPTTAINNTRPVTTTSGLGFTAPGALLGACLAILFIRLR